MTTGSFEELDVDLDEFAEAEEIDADVPPSTKLERRRRIEELMEEKRLEEELRDFG